MPNCYTPYGTFVKRVGDAPKCDVCDPSMTQKHIAFALMMNKVMMPMIFFYCFCTNGQ